MNRFSLLTAAAALLLSSGSLCADEQSEIRLNPEIFNDGYCDVDVSRYDFLKLDLNKIELNGDDWSGLARKFEASRNRDSLFTVVYLGDSHVQADYNGSTLRRILQRASYGAGRGLVIPFKLAKTNQPLDYSIAIDGAFDASKLLKTPWLTDMPFSGIGIQPVAEDYTIHLSCETPFKYMRFFHIGDATVCGVSDTTLLSGISRGWVELSRDVNSIDVNFKRRERSVFGGVELLSDTVGTLVHSIGNNGATFASYPLSDDFERGVASLAPDLVIVALGTNEAFSRISEENLAENIDALMSVIHTASPKTKILLVSPTECYRRVYRRRGKRRRRTSSLVVNTKVARVRNVILDYAKDKGIAVYDRFALAGGSGSAVKLKSTSVIGRDGIHCSVTGYRLWGTLMGDAIIQQLKIPESFEADSETVSDL